MDLLFHLQKSLASNKVALQPRNALFAPSIVQTKVIFTGAKLIAMN
jgi:hypothetical protein